MKITHLSTASALALVLALGLPSDGAAKQAADQAGGPAATEDRADQQAPAASVTPPEDAAEAETPAPAADDPATTAQVGQDRLALADLEEKLGEFGIENREAFGGQVVVAQSSEGDPIIMLIGPEGFERGEVVEFDAGEFEELRDQLSEAGFEHIRQEHALPIVQGTLDNYYVFAASGDPEWGPEADAARRGVDFDRDAFEDRLGDAGIEDRTEFEGKLVRGSTEAGESITLLVGPQGFAGDEEIDISESDLRDRFEDAGMSDVRAIEENIHMIRGSYENWSVLAFGGQGLAEGPMATGTVAPQPQPEAEMDVPDPDEIEVEEGPEDID